MEPPRLVRRCFRLYLAPEAALGHFARPGADRAELLGLLAEEREACQLICTIDWKNNFPAVWDSYGRMFEGRDDKRVERVLNQWERQLKPARAPSILTPA